MKTLKRGDEGLLIEDARKGSKDACGILYNKHYPKIFCQCKSMSGDHEEAKDLTQDILLKAFQNLHTFRGESRFSTWLYAITINHCLEYLRRRKQGLQLSIERLEFIQESWAETNKLDDGQEMSEQIFSSLEKIPHQEKELLLMRYDQCLSIRDMQEKLHISPSAVKMRLMRAKNKLKKVISREETLA